MMPFGNMNPKRKMYITNEVLSGSDQAGAQLKQLKAHFVRTVEFRIAKSTN